MMDSMVLPNFQFLHFYVVLIAVIVALDDT